MKKIIVMFSFLAFLVGSYSQAFTLENVSNHKCPAGYHKVVEGNPEHPEKICCVRNPEHHCRELPNCKPSDGKCRKVINGTVQPGDTCSGQWYIDEKKCCEKESD